MEQLSHQPEVLESAGGNSASIYERITRTILSGFRKGHLTIILPSNGEWLIGDPSSDLRATIRINDRAFFRRAVLYGDIGFAESYLEGEWDSDNVTAALQIMILNMEDLAIFSGSKKRWSALNLLEAFNRVRHLFRANTITGSRRNIAEHYDLSNEFYRLWLDPSMTYSSAVWADPSMSLEQAQTEKYDRLCRKLKLTAQDHLLEIGSGWGGFAVHAAKRYGCRITTITISAEQFAFAKERFEREGVSHLVEIKLQDYRLLEGTYDKIVSIEMLEAVGHKFLPAYFKACHRLLKKNGILALQVITSPDSRYADFRKGIDFIQKHVFPGSLLPSVGAINEAVNASGDMHLHHLEEFGRDYARTLNQWKANFNQRLAHVRALGFNNRFIRKWNYYLSYCEAGFTTRNISVVQMVYARPNNPLV